MQLKYELVCVTCDLTRRGVTQLLQEEYDFAYAPLMPGGKRLFREHFPKVGPARLPLEVLLFKYVATEEDGSMGPTAALDITAGIVHLDVMGWDSRLWEWKACQEEGKAQGLIDIFYRYDSEGDDLHIYYDKASVGERA
jgi:hypothetical protein